MNLCQYKNIFGEPGKGVHAYRLFGVAIVDVVMTIIGAYLLAKYFPKTKFFSQDGSPKKLNFVHTMISLFILGIIMHRLFCVRTTVDKLLFN
jgi:hypothetical protein